MTVGTNLNQAGEKEKREVKPSFSNNIHRSVQSSLDHVTNAAGWITEVVVLETSRFCSKTKRSKHFPVIKNLFKQSVDFFISNKVQQENLQDDRTSPITKLKKEILTSHKDTYTKPEEVSFLYNSDRLKELSYLKGLEEDPLKKITPEQFALFFGAKVKSEKELTQLYQFYLSDVQDSPQETDPDTFIENFRKSITREEEFSALLVEGNSKAPKAAQVLLKKKAQDWAQSLERGEKQLFIVGAASARSDETGIVFKNLVEQCKQKKAEEDHNTVNKKELQQEIAKLQKEIEKIGSQKKPGPSHSHSRNIDVLDLAMSKKNKSRRFDYSDLASERDLAEIIKLQKEIQKLQKKIKEMDAQEEDPDILKDIYPQLLEAIHSKKNPTDFLNKICDQIFEKIEEKGVWKLAKGLQWIENFGAKEEGEEATPIKEYLLENFRKNLYEDVHEIVLGASPASIFTDQQRESLWKELEKGKLDPQAKERFKKSLQKYAEQFIGKIDDKLESIFSIVSEELPDAFKPLITKIIGAAKDQKAWLQVEKQTNGNYTLRLFIPHRDFSKKTVVFSNIEKGQLNRDFFYKILLLRAYPNWGLSQTTTFEDLLATIQKSLHQEGKREEQVEDGEESSDKNRRLLNQAFCMNKGLNNKEFKKLIYKKRLSALKDFWPSITPNLLKNNILLQTTLKGSSDFFAKEGIRLFKEGELSRDEILKIYATTWEINEAIKEAKASDKAYFQKDTRISTLLPPKISRGASRVLVMLGITTDTIDSVKEALADTFGKEAEENIDAFIEEVLPDLEAASKRSTPSSIHADFSWDEFTPEKLLKKMEGVKKGLEYDIKLFKNIRFSPLFILKFLTQSTALSLATNTLVWFGLTSTLMQILLPISFMAALPPLVLRFLAYALIKKGPQVLEKVVSTEVYQGVLSAFALFDEMKGYVYGRIMALVFAKGLKHCLGQEIVDHFNREMTDVLQSTTRRGELSFTLSNVNLDYPDIDPSLVERPSKYITLEVSEQLKQKAFEEVDAVSVPTLPQDFGEKPTYDFGGLLFERKFFVDKQIKKIEKILNIAKKYEKEKIGPEVTKRAHARARYYLHRLVRKLPIEQSNYTETIKTEEYSELVSLPAKTDEGSDISLSGSIPSETLYQLQLLLLECQSEKLSYDETSELLASKYALLAILSKNMSYGIPDAKHFKQHFSGYMGKKVLAEETRNQVFKIAEYFACDLTDRIPKQNSKDCFIKQVEKYLEKEGIPGDLTRISDTAKVSHPKGNILFNYEDWGILSKQEKSLFKEEEVSKLPIDSNAKTLPTFKLTKEYLSSSQEGKELTRFLRDKDIREKLIKVGINPDKLSDFELRKLLFENPLLEIESGFTTLLPRDFEMLRKAWFIARTPPGMKGEALKHSTKDGQLFCKLVEKQKEPLWTLGAAAKKYAPDSAKERFHSFTCEIFRQNNTITSPLLLAIDFNEEDQEKEFFAETVKKETSIDSITKKFRKTLFSESEVSINEVMSHHFLERDSTLVQDPLDRDAFILKEGSKTEKIPKSLLSESLLSIIKRKQMQDYELITRHKSMQIIKALTFFDKNPILLDDKEFLLQLELLLLGMGSLEAQFKTEETSLKVLGEFFKRHLLDPEVLENKLHVIEIGIQAQRLCMRLDPNSKKFFPDFRGALNSLLEKAKQEEDFGTRVSNIARILQSFSLFYYGIDLTKLSGEEGEQAVSDISRLLYAQKNLKEDTQRHKEYRAFLRRAWMKNIKEYFYYGNQAEIEKLVRQYAIDSGIPEKELPSFFTGYYPHIKYGDHLVDIDFNEKSKTKEESPLQKEARDLAVSLGDLGKNLIQTNESAFYFPDSKLTISFTIDHEKMTKTPLVSKKIGEKQYKLISERPENGPKGARYWIEQNNENTPELLLFDHNRLLSTYFLRANEDQFTIVGEKQIIDGQEVCPVPIAQCSHGLKLLDWFYPVEKMSIWADPKDLQKMRYFRLNDLNLLFKVQEKNGSCRAKLVGDRGLYISDSQRIPKGGGSLNRHANSLFLEDENGEKHLLIVPQNIKTFLTTYLLKMFADCSLPPLAQKYLASVSEPEINSCFFYQMDEENNLISRDTEAMVYLLVNAFVHGDYSECNRIYKELKRMAGLEPFSSQTNSYLNLLTIPFALSNDPQTETLTLKLEALQRKNTLLLNGGEFSKGEFDSDLITLDLEQAHIFKWMNLQRTYSHYLDKLENKSLLAEEKLDYDEELFVIKSIHQLNVQFLSKLEVPTLVRKYTNKYLAKELTSSKIKKRYEELILESGDEIPFKDQATKAAKAFLMQSLPDSCSSSEGTPTLDFSSMGKIVHLLSTNPFVSITLGEKITDRIQGLTTFFDSFAPLEDVPCTLTEILPKEIVKHFLVYYRLATNSKDPYWDQAVFDEKREQFKTLLSSWQGHFADPAANFCFSALSRANSSLLPYLTAEQLELIIMGFDTEKNEISIYREGNKDKPTKENGDKEEPIKPQEKLLRRKKELEYGNKQNSQIRKQLYSINVLLEKYEILERRISKTRRANKQIEIEVEIEKLKDQIEEIQDQLYLYEKGIQKDTPEADIQKTIATFASRIKKPRDKQVKLEAELKALKEKKQSLVIEKASLIEQIKRINKKKKELEKKIADIQIISDFTKYLPNTSKSASHDGTKRIMGYAYFKTRLFAIEKELTEKTEKLKEIDKVLACEEDTLLSSFPKHINSVPDFFEDLFRKSRRDFILAEGMKKGFSSFADSSWNSLEETVKNIESGAKDILTITSGVKKSISSKKAPDKEAIDAGTRLLTSPLVTNRLPTRALRVTAKALRLGRLGLTSFRTVTKATNNIKAARERYLERAENIADSASPMSEELSKVLSQREAALNKTLTSLKDEYFTEELGALEKEEEILTQFQCAEDSSESTKAFIQEMNEKMQVFRALPKERITRVKFKEGKSPQILQAELLSLKEDVQELLVKERRDIERLVNHLPTNGEQTDEQILENFGKRMRLVPITFDRIFECFLKDDYKSLFLHSHLKKEEIPLLKQKIYLHMIMASRFNTLFASFDNIPLGNTHDFSEVLSMIGNHLASKRVYSFNDRSESERLIRTNLAFECGSKKMLRPKQREVLKLILTTKSLKIVSEAIMGLGKSFVISPEIGFFVADGAQLMQFIWPATVAKANIDFMGKWSNKIYTQTAFTLNTSRNREWTEDVTWAFTTSLSKAVLSRNHLHLTKEQEQALELIFLEHLLGKAKHKVSDKSLEQMKKALLIIRKQGKKSVDEFPLASDPIQELNFPLGKKKRMPKEWISCMENLMKYLSSDLDVRRVFDISKHPYVSLSEETYKGQLLSILSRKVVPIIIKDAFSPEQRERLSAIQVKVLEDYISGNAKSIPDFIKRSNNRGIIELYKSLLTVIVPKALEQVPNVNFTLSQLGDLEYAIPSKGNKNPQEGSTIRDIFAAYIKTHILYQHDRLSRQQIIKFISQLQNQAQAEKERTKIPIDQTKAAKYFRAKTGGHNLFEINDSNREEIYRILTNSNEVTADYIRIVISPTMTLHLENLSSNSSNFTSMSKSFIGLTGTPEKGTQPFETLLLEDRATGGKSVSISAKKCQEKTAILTLKIQTPKALLKTLLEDHFTEEAHIKTRALIDVGAYLRGLDNQEVAKIILRQLTEKNCGLEAVVYYDNKKGFVVLQKGAKVAVPLSESRIPPEKRFTYYDQARTVGSDIPQCKYAQAIVTIGEKTTFDDFAQGFWRMRGIESLEQKLLLVINKEIEKLALKESEVGKEKVIDFRDAASFMLKNGAVKSSERTYLSDKNDMSDIVRRAVLDKVLFASTIGKSKSIVNSYEKVFVQKFNTNLTQRFGGIGQMVSPIKVFDVLRSSLLQTLQEGNYRIFTSEEVAEIYSKLEKIGKDPKRYPEKVYVLTDGNQIVNEGLLDDLNGESRSEADQDQDMDTELDTELDQDQTSSNDENREVSLPNRTTWKKDLDISKEDWINRFNPFKLQKKPEEPVVNTSLIETTQRAQNDFDSYAESVLDQYDDNPLLPLMVLAKEGVSTVAFKAIPASYYGVDKLKTGAKIGGKGVIKGAKVSLEVCREVFYPATPEIYPLQDALLRSRALVDNTIPISIFSESIFVSNNFVPKRSGRVFTSMLSSFDQRQKSIAEVLIIEKVIEGKKERKLILIDSDGAKYWRNQVKEDAGQDLRYALFNIATEEIVAKGAKFKDVEVLKKDPEFQKQITQLKFINGDLNYSDSQKKILRDLIKRAGPEKMEQAFTTLHETMGHGNYKGSEVEQLFLDVRGVPLQERFTI